MSPMKSILAMLAQAKPKTKPKKKGGKK